MADPELTPEQIRQKRQRVRLVGAVAILLAALLVVVGFGTGVLAERRSEVAISNAQNIAEEVKAQCAKGPLLVDNRDLCAKANQVAAAPAEPVAGPQGPPGPPGDQGPPGPRGPKGIDGMDGSDGTDGRDGTDGNDGEPGDPGPAGADGNDGTDGTNGVDGTDGADGAAGPPGPPGPAGPAGKDGATGPQGERGPAGQDGQPGAPGQPGADGVGITSVQCVGEGDSSHWVVSFSNGMTQTSDGPCRLNQPGPPVTINP